MPFSKRFLARLGAPADTAEQGQIARVLASARLFLACAGLLAIYLDPTEPSRYKNLAYSLLIAYVVYSALIWLFQQRRQHVRSSFPWIHAVDVLFPAIFTLFTAGPNSPFFLYFVFVLTAAAFRWGLIETVTTAVTVVVLMTVEAILLGLGSAHFPRAWVAGEFEINRFVIRILYLLILGLLIGYLAEEQKQLRAESAVVMRLMSKARVQSGMRGTMQAILGELLRLFSARRALVVLQQANSHRVFLWHSDGTQSGNSIGLSELTPDQCAAYMADCPLHTFFSECRGNGGAWVVWALDGDGHRTRALPGWSPVSCPEIREARSVLSVAFMMGEEWTGRVLLFDAITGLEKFNELRFLQTLLRQLSPAIYTVYLLRRLRARAGALERARVARELHDGAIQALIAVEMEVDVLRREAAQPAYACSVPSQLERIQELLREQVFNLRTLMQQLRRVEVGPGQLLDSLSDVVERFRRDSGIAAQFVCGLDEVELPPRVGRELVRIVQEALVNVRKHSGAGSVLVRLGLREGRWTLSVEDDGKGLPFSGRRSLTELDAGRQGPEIIKERVRVLGGDLQIESQPGQGCRLEITLPQKAQVAYV